MTKNDYDQTSPCRERNSLTEIARKLGRGFAARARDHDETGSHKMRSGHAYRLKDIGKCVRSLGQLGKTVLHEAVSIDQAQWNESPTIDGESRQQSTELE